MVVWIIGMSGAGKTVIGKEIYIMLKEKLSNLIFLDGDDFRNILGDDLGYSLDERKKNADRICRMCKFLNDQEINVICCILSLFQESRDWNRKNIEEYYEVFINVSFEELVKRDSKELYKKALNGEIKNVVGVDINFQPPVNPDLEIINEGDETIEQLANKILDYLTSKIKY